MRIVSLLPSTTELVSTLGLEHQLVGISHECDYPTSITHLTKRPKILFARNNNPSLEDSAFSRRHSFDVQDIFNPRDNCN